MKLSISPADVTNILLSVINGGDVDIEYDSSHLEVSCEEMPIARLILKDEKYSVVALACYGAGHETHPLYKDLSKKLKELNAAAGRPERVCHICNGKEWLIPKESSCITAAKYGAAIGYYRGIKLVKSGELEKAADSSIEDVFSSMIGAKIIDEVRKTKPNE
jgi:hypothetical protein